MTSSQRFGRKLSVLERRAILERCAKGDVHLHIARDFGISREYVRILNNAAGLPSRMSLLNRLREDRRMEHAQAVADAAQDRANARLRMARKVADHVRSGKPRSELAAILGIKPQCVSPKIAWLKLRYPDLFSFLIPYAKHTVYANEPPVHHGASK